MRNSKLTIPKSEFSQRLDATRQALRDLNFDALLAVSGYGERDGNVCYLCGHKNAFPYSNRTDVISGLGYSAFLVPVEGETTLISPLGYQSDVVVGVDRAKTGTNLARELVSSISESHLEKCKLALAGSDIIPAVYLDELRRNFPELSIDYGDHLVAQQRMVKSENELQLIREASRVADRALAAAVGSIKPGMAESEVGTVARKKAMELGADYVVRDRIHSGSEIGRLRWPFASKKKIRKGELVSIDFVGWVNTYGFDILRVGCAGRPNKQQRRLIETAGEATQAMSSALTDNSPVSASIERLKTLEKNGIKISPFGHAIGLEIVESPYLLAGVSDTVKKNMVFCVEPDVKAETGSASIENEVLVTGGKPEVLTKLPVDPWD